MKKYLHSSGTNNLQSILILSVLCLTLASSYPLQVQDNQQYKETIMNLYDRLDQREILSNPGIRFMQGFSQGAFKMQFRRSSDCMSDGLQLTLGMVNIMFKATISSSPDDEENMGDIVREKIIIKDYLYSFLHSQHPRLALTTF
ncbi:UNKNOWN [Stylonychia lemnae]|uniref:Uncharacterized protein n=1 Tax=Stylonychia lemnae TaxID=5949 RepID=A0A078B531_STYLE|nr:UNKNOWN [Stylonychia lemnae]|eukprot:CDW89529.1 UNKNOWN [Stylonychia lemnae]